MGRATDGPTVYMASIDIMTGATTPSTGGAIGAIIDAALRAALTLIGAIAAGVVVDSIDAVTGATVVDIEGSIPQAGPQSTEQDSAQPMSEVNLPDVAGRYGNLECEEAADAMVGVLTKNGQNGEVIVLRFPGAYKGMVICYSYDGGNTAISYTGMHQGVKYNNLVYDNLHPYGMPEEAWIADFGTALPIPPRIIRMPF